MFLSERMLTLFSRKQIPLAALNPRRGLLNHLLDLPAIGAGRLALVTLVVADLNIAKGPVFLTQRRLAVVINAGFLRLHRLHDISDQHRSWQIGTLGLKVLF